MEINNELSQKIEKAANSKKRMNCRFIIAKNGHMSGIAVFLGDSKEVCPEADKFIDDHLRKGCEVTDRGITRQVKWEMDWNDEKDQFGFYDYCWDKTGMKIRGTLIETITDADGETTTKVWGKKFKAPEGRWGIPSSRPGKFDGYVERAKDRTAPKPWQQR
tara:strand:- start:49 stop:531 length:483 start_codon:yes stop_codon:yes gene_type:complete